MTKEELIAKWETMLEQGLFCDDGTADDVRELLDDLRELRLVTVEQLEDLTRATRENAHAVTWGDAAGVALSRVELEEAWKAVGGH